MEAHEDSGTMFDPPTRRPPLPPFGALLGRLGSLRTRSMAEVRDRGIQALRAAAERAGFSRDSSPLTLAPGRVSDYASGRAFGDSGEALQSFRRQASGRFFAGTADALATIRAIQDADPAARCRILEAARAAAEGHPRILGHEALDFGCPPDWHVDPVNGRRAPLVHWSRVPYLDDSVVGDHKIIWELNRHQWLVSLAKAYLVDGDSRWAEKAFSHIDSWIEGNPPKLGINWASSLEIAFRSIAWLWVLHLLRDSPALTDQRFARIVRVLAISGRHIENNLSTWFSPNTHLTGEALGLLYLGCALPDLKHAARWRTLGAAVLARWMPQHVRPDGTYLEQSTHYARYTADFLIHAIALARRSGMDVPSVLPEALRRSARFLRHIARPDGSLPLIGDDDGGRLLFLDPAPADDIRPTLSTASRLLDDPTLACARWPFSEEADWLLGAQARPTIDTDAAHEEGGSRLFSEGGFAILRDGWGEASSQAVLDCGPHGMGNGGHAHADLGSFDLALRGRPVVVDPGTWSYLVTCGARDSFRGPQAHAVPLIDGVGSAEPAGAFSWNRVPRVAACVSVLSAPFDLVAFTHDGFAMLADPVNHRRALVRVRGDYWLVIDGFRSGARHDLTLGFPLARGLRATLGEAGAIVADGEGEVARFTSTARGSRWAGVNAWTSDAYGRRDPSVRLVQHVEMPPEHTVVTLIQSAHGSSQLEIRAAVEGLGASVEIAGPDGIHDRLLWDEHSGSFVDAAGRRVAWDWPGFATTRPEREPF